MCEEFEVGKVSGVGCKTVVRRGMKEMCEQRDGLGGVSGEIKVRWDGKQVWETRWRRRVRDGMKRCEGEIERSCDYC